MRTLTNRFFDPLRYIFVLLVVSSFFSWLRKMSFFPKGWGDYPPEYNREVHGTYNPSVNYGKRDTPFSQVKIKDLTSWLARRDKSPRAMAQAISRAWWRYQFKWVQPIRPGAAYIFQACFLVSLASFLLDFQKNRKEIKYRYH